MTIITKIISCRRSIWGLLSTIILLSTFLAGQSSFGQVTLGTSPYTQNFDAVGSGLPTGWNIYTGATSTSLGSTATLTTATTSWAAGTGQFANFASTTSTVANGGILLTSASSTANQASSTNRALGLQQTASFANPGGAYALRLTNTTGFTGFAMSFSMQQGGTTAGRTSTWRVDYGFGTTPTSFTTATTSPATVTTTAGTWGSTTVTVNFGTALDNNSQNVWIRIWPPAAATGSGNSPANGIDDFSLTYTATPTFTSTATGGLWNATGSWVGGVVPSAGATVNIVGPITINNTTGQISNTGIININNSGTLLCGYTSGASLTGTGTVNVNGTGILDIEQGGWPGTTNSFNYGNVTAGTGTLKFNNSSGSYGVNATDTWFPSTITNVNVAGAGGITLNSAHTISGLFQSSATVVNPGNITANGTLQLNSGYGWSGTGSPIYGSSSLLQYNSGGSPGRSIEWNQASGTIGTTAGYPNNVQVSNNTTLNFANGGTLTYKANGTLTVDSGSSLYQNYSGGNAGLAVVSDVTINGNITLGTSSGDLYVGGNLTVGSAANFSSNGRAVFFNGTGTQTIAKTAGGTVAFDYFIIDKTVGSVVLSSSPATDVTVNASSGNVLQLINTGGLDLNGRTMTFNNSGGAIYVNGARTISSAVAGGSLAFTNYKVVANNAGTGSLSLAANVVVNLNTNGNIDFGKSGATYITTLNGTLSINSTTSCFVNTNPPIYGAASLLKYNSGGTYGRGLEWSATSGAGYPNDVQVTNSTTLNYPNTGSGAFSTNLSIARDLTIDSASSLYMDYGTAGNKSGSLTIGRNISISGNISLGDAVGGDLNVGGNWTRTGTFTPNGRAVNFNSASAQTLTGATTFDFLTLSGNGGVTLQASSAVTVNNTLTLGSGASTGKLTLGANTFTIAATGSISGASSSAFIVTNTATSLLKRNSVGGTATSFPVGNLSTSYTPLTITNTGTTNDLSVGSSATIDNAVTDATKIVTLQWSVVSGGAGAVGTIVYNWNTGNQAASYSATGTGELGVYTTGPYAITSLGTMSGQTKTATGIALASGTNKMVIGNTGAVYTPPPANDECTGAISLTVNATATAGNNALATKSNPSTISGTAYTTGTAKDMWYTFTPSCSGSHTITMTPTGFDGAVGLFSGGTCPNPTFTSLADAGASGTAETITFTATAGVTYRILVWGYNSASGNFTIGVTTSVTPNFTLANTGTPATGNVASGTNNAVLYGFALTPTACTNSFDFTAASIATSGTATSSDLSNFRLIVDANANGVADSGEIASPIGTVSTLANPLSFTVTGQTGLTAVTRYLLIADVNSAATGGNTFTASMAAANVTASVTVSGTAAGNTQTITAASIAIADNTQVTAANIFRGSTNNIISKAQLTVSGQSTTVTAMNFVTAGVTGGYTSADIATGGFKLWVSTTNSFGSATQVGTGVSSAKVTATNTETLSFTTSQSLTVGTTYYYWLTVDVAATATVARTITVNGLSNASVTSAGTTITGTTTAAGAQTIIAPTLVIANNTTVPAGNVLVGSTNNIVARAQFTVTNATVALSAMSYVTASNASGYTSADIATGGFKLWVNTTNTFAGATQVGTGQTSTKSTGASTETITFTATQTLTTGVYYYWLTADIASTATPAKVIIVNGLSSTSLTSTTTGVAISGTSSASGTQTIVAPTLTISNNTQITTQNLFAGSTNNIISKAQVVPTNDNVAASAISFVTAGNATGYTSADITSGGFKLWVNTTNTFAGATQVGSGQSSTKTTATNTETITFTATQNFTLGTTYYYWLTADLDSAATVGNIIIVNGLSSASITTTTTGAVVTGTTSATGNQTITVPTVTLANTGTPAAGSIAIGASNVVLFGFGLTPNTSVDFTAASITTSGTATSSDLSNFRLVYDANANGLADTSEITGAIGTVSTISGTLAFTGLTGQTAFSAVRRYLLIADASSGATSGRTFTGSLTAANITTTATTNTGSATGNTQTLVYIAAAGEIVINQLNPGYSAASNEYIELVNKTGKTFDLSTLTIIYYSAAGGSNSTTVGTLSGTLQPYSFWLLGTSSTVNVGATSSLAADGTFTGGMAANNGQISLQRISDGVQIDGVAYGTITSNAVNEGAAAPAGTTAPSVSIKRTIDGNDTNSNSADFSTVTNANIYLRNSTGRLASAGAAIAAGSYRDLSVTGSSSIAGNVSLSSQLRLDNNGILATSSNTLTLASTASVSRISGWVNGSLKKNVATGATSRTFEIGGATFYRPVTVVFGSVTTAGDLTATLSASAGDYPQIANSGIDSSKSVNRYWTLTNSGIAFTNYGATFTFDATDVDSGANTANFIVRNYNGSWNTSTAGTRTSTTTQATGITTFGDFVIGETTGSPTVASNPSGFTGCPGGSTSFSSTSTSVPTPTIAWERGISGTYTTITSVLDGGVYSNFNTSTLSISNTSGLGGYTYRAVYTNINGTATSTSATLNVGVTKTYSSGWSPSTPTSIDAAVISSNYNVAADINACSLTVNSGAIVLIPSGNNVTLSGTLTVNTGSSFTLSNNANLLQTGTGSNSGNIVVKRNSAALKRLDYTLWSSPVSGQGLYAFSPFTFANRFYIYNSSTDLYAAAGLNVTGTNADGVNGTDGNNVQFAAATGYLIRVPWDHPTSPTIWTGTFTGVPNNGTITRSGLTSGLFYAIGNPYPSTISADQFIADNSIGNNALTPGDGLYFWRKTNNAAASSYATYTTAGGVKSGGDTLNIVPNGVIQVGEGFIVKSTSSSLTFNNGQRIANNADQFLRTASPIERNRIWLNLSDTNNVIVNQMMVAYMTGATQGIDAAIDGRYFNDNQTALNSFLNNEEFAIQGRSLPFDSADVVPLAFKSASAGNFSIGLENTDGLFAGGAQPIYLKDNQTNTVHDLSNGAYVFATTAGTFNNRFELVYQTQLGTGHTTFNSNNVIIYNQNADFVINTGNIIMSSVKVFDIRGRLIQERKEINASQTTINAGLANEVLLVQITSQDGIVVTKKVIR